MVVEYRKTYVWVLSMLRSPKYANMGHWPNIYITNSNIYCILKVSCLITIGSTIFL